MINTKKIEEIFESIIYGKGKFCLGNFPICVVCVSVYVCTYTQWVMMSKISLTLGLGQNEN